MCVIPSSGASCSMPDGPIPGFSFSCYHLKRSRGFRSLRIEPVCYYRKCYFMSLFSLDNVSIFAGAFVAGGVLEQLPLSFLIKPTSSLRWPGDGLAISYYRLLCLSTRDMLFPFFPVTILFLDIFRRHFSLCYLY